MINTYLGLLSLQVAVAALGAVFISLGAIVAITNFTDINLPTGTAPTNYFLVGIFVGLLLIAGIFMFIAAYFESQKYCLYSIALIAFILILFVGGVIISFLNDPSMMKNVCINERCTVSLWLMSSKLSTNKRETDELGGNELYATTDWSWSTVEPEDFTDGPSAPPTTKDVNLPTTSTTEEEYDDNDSDWKPNRKRSHLGRPLSYKAEKSVPPKIFDGPEKTKNHFGIQNNSQLLQSRENNDPVEASIYLNTNFLFGENTYERSRMFRPKKSYPKNEEYNYGDKVEDKAENMEHEDEKSSSSPSGILGLALAIILFVVNIVFFVTTIIVIWSYKRELQVVGNFADKYGLERY